jgi:hypothetical protein
MVAIDDRRRGNRAFSSRSAQLEFARRHLARLSKSGATWQCAGPSVPHDNWPAGRPPWLRQS